MIMTMDNIKKELKTTSYDFLKTNENLGDNIILLGMGGSYAYGTNNENSDLDIRGIAVNSKKNILTRKDFDQYVDKNTDTVIYSFDKMIKLLCECNPNTIEILGLKPEHYLYKSKVGEELIENRKMFLSKRAIHTFGGYANAQLRRLENKSARAIGQKEREQHILNTILHASSEFPTKYFPMSEGSLNLYIDKSEQEDYDTEIFMDMNLSHYPLRDWTNMWNEMKSIVSSYSKIGKRNQKAIEHDKLGKHMAHLIRLYYMCFDILEYGEIITYRDKEHDILMSLRNGDEKYLTSNSVPTKEFYDYVQSLEERLNILTDKTELPDMPDMHHIENFVMYVNEMVVSR